MNLLGMLFVAVGGLASGYGIAKLWVDGASHWPWAVLGLGSAALGVIVFGAV